MDRLSETLYTLYSYLVQFNNLLPFNRLNWIVEQDELTHTFWTGNVNNSKCLFYNDSVACLY